MAEPVSRASRLAVSASLWLPCGIFAGVYALMMLAGQALLNDADTWWQIAVGQTIITQGRVPVADVYSFTFLDASWRSTQWLAQAIFALAYSVFGWAGVVSVAACAIAGAFALLARELTRYIPANIALGFLCAALMLAAAHSLARPHVLAWPLMVVWVAGLLRASDEQRAPSMKLLFLIALWANLHGGFILGLALIAPIALEAVLVAPKAQRLELLTRWILFGLAALLAACVNPYGWSAIDSSFGIIGMGQALKHIGEWRAVDMSAINELSVILLAGIALALWRGVMLPPMRILLVIGIVWMAISANRNQELVAFLVPLFIAAPIARQYQMHAGAAPEGHAGRIGAALASLLVLVATCATSMFDSYAPSMRNAPVAAFAEMRKNNVARVFNEYDFGGYLIAHRQPVFIDGRTELYGADFLNTYMNILDHADVGEIAAYLGRYKVDAILVRSGSRFAGVVDTMPGWKKIHQDGVASLYIAAL